jgi:hypothetical protein
MEISKTYEYKAFGTEGKLLYLSLRPISAFLKIEYVRE